MQDQLLRQRTVMELQHAMETAPRELWTLDIRQAFQARKRKVVAEST